MSQRPRGNPEDAGPGLMIIGSAVLIVAGSIFTGRLDLAIYGLAFAFGLFTLIAGVIRTVKGLRK